MEGEVSHIDSTNHVIWLTTNRGETHAEFRIADSDVERLYWPDLQKDRHSADGQKYRMLCGSVDLDGCANAWDGTGERCPACVAKLPEAVALAVRLIAECGTRKRRIRELQNPAFDISGLLP